MQGPEFPDAMARQINELKTFFTGLSVDVFENQAFRYGKNAYAVQFHSELTLAMMHRWTVKGAHRMESPGAQNKSRQLSQRAVHDPAIRQWLCNFLDIWIGDSEQVLKKAA